MQIKQLKKREKSGIGISLLAKGLSLYPAKFNHSGYLFLYYPPKNWVSHENIFRDRMGNYLIDHSYFIVLFSEARFSFNLSKMTLNSFLSKG